MIELGQSADGSLVIGTNEVFPADIKHVEYYRDQRLFSLVFEGDDEQSMLMPLEIPKTIGDIVQSRPKIIILEAHENSQTPMGYIVPLIQIGI